MYLHVYFSELGGYQSIEPSRVFPIYRDAQVVETSVSIQYSLGSRLSMISILAEPMHSLWQYGAASVPSSRFHFQ